MGFKHRICRRTNSRPNLHDLCRGERGSAKGSIILAAVLLIAGGAFAAYLWMSGGSQPVEKNSNAGKIAQHQKKPIDKTNPAASGQTDREKKAVSASKKDTCTSSADSSVLERSAIKAAAPKPSEERDAASQQDSSRAHMFAVHTEQNVQLERPIILEKRPKREHPSIPHAGPNKQQEHTNGGKQPQIQPPAKKPNQQAGRETFDQLIQRARLSLFTVLNITSYTGGNGQLEEYIELQGSGFLYDKYGRIVTNGHVVEGKTSVEIIGSDGKTYKGKVIGFSYNPDVALIEVPQLAGRTAFPIDKNKTYRIGDKVAAIADQLDVTLTVGNILDKNLNIKVAPNDPYFYPNLYVTSAATPPGFSGGPLIAVKAKKIIGINSLHNQTNDSLGYTIPFKEVESNVKAWSKKPMTEEEINQVYKKQTVQAADKTVTNVQKQAQKPKASAQTPAAAKANTLPEQTNITDSSNSAAADRTKDTEQTVPTDIKEEKQADQPAPKTAQPVEETANTLPKQDESVSGLQPEQPAAETDTVETTGSEDVQNQIESESAIPAEQQKPDGAISQDGAEAAETN